MSVGNRNRLLWGALALWCMLGAAFSVALGRAAGGGQMLMPLDDVYIHFQYARQLVLGQPYVYNPGEPATSGATSFLYPYVLAVGYLLGFQGRALGEWAVMVGWGALAGTIIGVWRLLAVWGVGVELRMLGVLLVASGVFLWHFNSGMETGLVALTVVWTLFAFSAQRWGWFAVWGSLLALVRPEGSAMAALAAALALFFYGRSAGWRARIWMALPLLACGVQPLVNALLTGSVVATGNQSKSILAMMPADPLTIAARIVGNWLNLWGAALTGAMTGLPIGLLGLLGLVALKARSWRVALLVAGWLVGVSVAISTLDNAFWHFHRYHMPLLIVLLSLAMVLLQRLPLRLQAALGVLLLGFNGLASASFVRAQVLNLSYVAQQPLAMAEWLEQNTPPQARVAVHDVGLMRYVGERRTLDMVGLTTPGAASHWRNGPGSVAELLLREQPNFIASYGAGHGYGLVRFEETLLLNDPLASFSVMLDETVNVALAASAQRITRPDYSSSVLLLRAEPASAAMRAYLEATEARLLTWINVADLASEQAVDYQWRGAPSAGFPTDVLQQRVLGEDLVLIDGMRRLSGGEQFTLHAQAGQPLLLVTRVHAVGRGALTIRVNGQPVAQRALVEAPGFWQEFATLIEGTESAQMLRVETEASLFSGEYAPASHWVYAANVPLQAALDDSLAVFGSDEAVFTSVDFDPQSGCLALEWQAVQPQPRDVRIFVHVYADVNRSLATQWDGYLLGLPMGNWLPVPLSATICLQVGALPDGDYTLAVGFYDPVTWGRVPVRSEVFEVREDGLIIARWKVSNG
jgi:hypothetical protein